MIRRRGVRPQPEVVCSVDNSADGPVYSRLRKARSLPRGASEGAVSGFQVKARSSGGERYLDTVEVSGSRPLAPTTPAFHGSRPRPGRNQGHDGAPRLKGQSAVETVEVILPGGAVRAFPHGTPLSQIAASLEPDLAKRAIAAVVDGI